MIKRAYQIIDNPAPYAASITPFLRPLCVLADEALAKSAQREISQFFGLPELLPEAHAIVGFEIIDEGSLSRIKSERCAFSSKPFFAFWILVRTCRYDRVRPSFDFIGAFRSAMFAEPSQDLIIASSRCQHRFHVIGYNPFVGEKLLIERTREVIFPDSSIQSRAAFIDHARH
jgi:hypothetical protein